MILLKILLFLYFPTFAAANEPSFFTVIGSTPLSLLPMTLKTTDEIDVSSHLFESLLETHWETRAWKPLLARSWTISPNGLEFTFQLNPLAKFSDGSPVTPEDVKFSFDLIFKPGVMSTQIRSYYEKISDVLIIDNKTILFKAKEKYFLNFEVCATLPIIQKKFYLELYEKDKTLNKAETGRKVLGTGPFVLDRFDDNQQIVLKRNDKYWNRKQMEAEGRWHLQQRVFKIIQEISVALEALKKGDINFMNLTSKQYSQETQSQPFTGPKATLEKVKTSNQVPVSYGYIGWNMTKPILQDANTRWALSHLVNLNLWIEKFDNGLTQPAISPYGPKSVLHNKKITPVPFNPTEARKRLKDGGWVDVAPDGILMKEGKRLELTILYPSQSKMMEPKLIEFRNQCAKVGISLVLKPLEWTSFLKLLDDKSFDGAVLAWSRSYEQDLKQIFHSSSMTQGGSNFVGYNNPYADTLLDEFRGEMNPKKRIEIAHKLEQVIYQDQPYTFLTESKSVLYAHSKKFKKPKDTFAFTIGQEFWKPLP